MKILLKQTSKFADFAVLFTETGPEIVQFVGKLDVENFDYLQLSESLRQLAIYTTCYITYKLIKLYTVTTVWFDSKKIKLQSHM